MSASRSAPDTGSSSRRVIGRILSEFALEGRSATIGAAISTDDFSFKIDRPILQLDSPPKTYMV